MSTQGHKEIQFEQPSDILLLANRYMLFIIALIVLAILILGYFFVLKPKIDNINSIELATTASESRRRGNEKLLTKLKALEVEYEDIIHNRQEDLDFLKRMVPQGEQVAEFFLIADRLAQARGFQLTSIDISDVLAKKPSNLDDDLAEAEIVTVDDLLASSGINTMLVRVSVSKQISEEDDISGIEVYNNFKDYLAELENNIRLIDVQAINFGPIAAETYFKGTINYSFDLDLVTYYR